MRKQLKNRFFPYLVIFVGLVLTEVLYLVSMGRGAGELVTFFYWPLFFTIDCCALISLIIFYLIRSGRLRKNPFQIGLAALLFFIFLFPVFWNLTKYIYLNWSISNLPTGFYVMPSHTIPSRLHLKNREMTRIRLYESYVNSDESLQLSFEEKKGNIERCKSEIERLKSSGQPITFHDLTGIVSYSSGVPSGIAGYLYNKEVCIEIWYGNPVGYTDFTNADSVRELIGQLEVVP